MKRFPLAVTGVGVICAAGSDSEMLWKTVLGGTTAIGPVSRAGFEHFPAPIAGELDEAWLEKQFTPDELVRYSRDTRAGVVAASEALAMAGVDPGLARTGLIVGKCQGSSSDAATVHSWIHSTADGIAEALRLDGPRFTISTACAAGGNAVGAAQDKLWAGEADIMLAGGVDLLDAKTYAGFSALKSLDDQPCSPYSRSGGLTLGEGAAFLVLEPLEAALRRGARVLCEVLGYGLSADAHHATAPDPTGRGATLAGLRALEEAGLSTHDITYVNGHGTGTEANDSTERRVMRGLFGDRATEVPITGTKSFTGHTLGAAGAVEAVVTALSILNQTVPPTVNFDHSTQHEFDFVPDEARPQPVDVVLSNNYAFGGNNVSVLLGRRSATRRQQPLEDVDVVISGVGLWGRPGLGLQEWAETLAGSAEHAVEDPVVLLGRRSFAAPSAWRHMNSFTKGLIAVTRLALEDASLSLDREARDRAAVFSATMSGPAAIQHALDAGARRVPSAHEFSQIVLNAPAGAVCQTLGLRGPTTTIVSGGASGTIALQTAVEFIKLGRAETVVVLAAEEASATTRRLYDSVDELDRITDPAAFEQIRALPRGGDISTAAVALVLQRGDGLAADQSAYCRISGICHSSRNEHQYRHDVGGGGLREALEAARTQSGWRTDAAGLLVGLEGLDDSLQAAHVTATRGLEGRRLHPKAHTGECEAASGLANVALAAAAVAGRLSPLVLETSPRALATSASFGGVYGAVALDALVEDVA